jgi:glycosyltransferase involved in cell wall biosynthesis
MRVALELQPCCGQRSGIGTYTYELARHMSGDKDLEMRGNLFNFLMRNDDKRAIDCIGFPINYNTSMPYGLYRRIWNLLPLDYSEMFAGKADVTHFFNFIVPPKVKGKVIDTIYDLVYIRYPETMEKRNLKRIENGIQYSLERSDAVVTDSQFIKNEIVQHYGCDPGTIHVIYPAASVSNTDLSVSYLADKWRIEPPYILFIGNIEPRKNLARLIKAFEKVRKEMPQRIQLVLAGGKGWKSEAISKAAEDSPYCGDIVFTGYISDAEKSTLYRHAEMFAFPSVYEGFGMPVLEAMICGTPTVCSNAASLPEVAGDSAILADPFSEADMAEKMAEILADREKASNMSALGINRARFFDWDRSANELMHLYKSLG